MILKVSRVKDLNFGFESTSLCLTNPAALNPLTSGTAAEGRTDRAQTNSKQHKPCQYQRN